MIEVGEGDFFPVDDLAKVQPEETCGGCSLRGPCPGLYAGYREVHGDGEVRAVAGRPRSNSLPYVHEALQGTLGDVPAACPVRTGGVTPWDRGRVLFLREGDRVERFRAESRDFADVEIARMKLDLGQVYDGVSAKDAPDDFARDLVGLRRSDLCDACDARDACGGLWERGAVDVFTRDDEAVRACLAELRGDVLDVGCGEGRYEDIVGPRARAGVVRWFGLEPDPARAAAMRESAPWAEVRVGEVEDLADVARFDGVLILRSWNHLRDPQRAVLAVVRALRPGGTLLVVDSVAFGVLGRRPPRPAGSRADGSGSAAATSRWEHYRNDDAARAHATLADHPLELLELLERRDVAPGTSSEWLLRYRRA
jgi:SAM-dependent methyltransferase